MLSAKEAANAVGMSKNGIIRAIHSGRLSATRNANGQFEIDPAELFRVYDPVATADHLNWEVADNETPVQSNAVDDKVSLLERIIADKEEIIRAKDVVIEVLTQENTRLAAEVAQLAPPQAKRGWWQRLLGGGG